MVDKLTPDARSKLMSRVKGKDTKPEITVRRVAHRLGFRFRLHQKELPGRPDLVFPRRRKVIFVHGCFWHGHDCPRGSRPKSNEDFWRKKLDANRQRDAAVVAALKAEGWSVLTIWECETHDRTLLAERLSTFLDGR